MSLSLLDGKVEGQAGHHTSLAATGKAVRASPTGWRLQGHGQESWSSRRGALT